MIVFKTDMLFSVGKLVVIRWVTLCIVAFVVFFIGSRHDADPICTYIYDIVYSIFIYTQYNHHYRRWHRK